MAIGTVKFFNTGKGFGFISPEGGAKDVFVHATAVEAAGMYSLSEGQRISFDIQPDAKGSKAVNLKAAQGRREETAGAESLPFSRSSANMRILNQESSPWVQVERTRRRKPKVALTPRREGKPGSWS